MQRSGVFIGSCAAPVLSDIFLSRVDRAIERNLCGLASNICRYVDECLAFVNSDKLPRIAIDLLKVFHESGFGLKFTVELPKKPRAAVPGPPFKIKI